MNSKQKHIISFMIPLVALVIALFGYIFFNGGMEKSPQNNASETQQITGQNVAPKVQYDFYTPELFAQSAKGRRVLFFFASWCPTCKAADLVFMDSLAQIPTDVTVIKVNYKDSQTDEAEKELARKYGITYQHTFVQIDAEGNEITKWNGGDITELLTNLK